MNPSTEKAFTKVLSAEGIYGPAHETYLREFNTDPSAPWVSAVIDSKLSSADPNCLPDGNEREATVEHNEADQAEYVAATDDPHDFLFCQIDGANPDERDWPGLSEMARRLGVAMLWRNDGTKRSPDETQKLVASFLRPIMPSELGNAENVHREFGVSPASQSQFWKLILRPIVGDIPNLAQRSKAARDKMADAQLTGANHWKRRKKERDKLSPAALDQNETGAGSNVGTKLNKAGGVQ